MDDITIDEKQCIVFAYDAIGKEYYIWDKLTHKRLWYSSFRKAKEEFKRMTK